MRITLLLAGVFGLLAVTAGTIRAHVLEGGHPDAIDLFNTGQRYHMYHALAILGCGWLFRHGGGKLAGAAVACFALGIVLFAGSLYALALTGRGWLGAITPFGGTLFLLGWALLIIAALTNRKHHEAS
ncbi:MAG: DUF423 domain-containing protein [Phycisphaeraceae bacterium]